MPTEAAATGSSMALTKPHYLAACLAAFGEVSKDKYGVPFDLSAIERTVATLRSKRTLTYQDLRSFEAKEHWWFERYWVFPPEHKVTPALAKKSFDFWHLPKNETELISELLDVFKSIELVSIILRFVKPEAYGILSPPVERVLDVRRGSDAVETYRNYLADLREITRRCGFARTADADMALWVLHERCFGEYRDPPVERAYLADPLLLRLRAKNLVLPLAELSYPKLAEALHHVKPELAALIACHSFEALIRRAAELLTPTLARSRADLTEVIQILPSYGGITQVRKAEWKRLKLIRNRLFHEGRAPTPKETADLVAEVVQLERDLTALQETPPSRGR
jgi:hypothetical protein